MGITFRTAVYCPRDCVVGSEWGAWLLLRMAAVGGGVARLMFVLSEDNSVSKLRRSAVNKFGSLVRGRHERGNGYCISAMLFSRRARILRSEIRLSRVSGVARGSCAIHNSATLVSTVNNTVRRVNGIRGCTERRSIPRRALFIVVASKVRGTDHVCSDGGIGGVVRHRGGHCN